MFDLKPYYHYLNLHFHQTIDPKKGDETKLHDMSRNILLRMTLGERSFSVGDFIWVELCDAMVDARKSLSYALYIMYIIEKVTKDCIHESYRVKKKTSSRLSHGASSSRAAPPLSHAPFSS